MDGGAFCFRPLLSPSATAITARYNKEALLQSLSANARSQIVPTISDVIVQLGLPLLSTASRAGVR